MLQLPGKIDICIWTIVIIEVGKVTYSLSKWLFSCHLVLKPDWRSKEWCWSSKYYVSKCLQTLGHKSVPSSKYSFKTKVWFFCLYYTSKSGLEITLFCVITQGPKLTEASFFYSCDISKIILRDLPCKKKEGWKSSTGN